MRLRLAQINIQSSDSGKVHEIHNATLDGDSVKIQKLLDAGIFVDLRDQDGRTALHVAAADVRLLTDGICLTCCSLGQGGDDKTTYRQRGKHHCY